MPLLAKDNNDTAAPQINGYLKFPVLDYWQVLGFGARVLSFKTSL